MDKNKIIERLRALAADSKKRTKAAQLRDVIDEVEAALAAGVKQADVVKELADNGLEMTLATFDTTLRRIRKGRGSTKTKRVYDANTKIDHELSQAEPSHKPADIDKIISSTPDLSALAKHAKGRKK